MNRNRVIQRSLSISLLILLIIQTACTSAFVPITGTSLEGQPQTRNVAYSKPKGEHLSSAGSQPIIYKQQSLDATEETQPPVDDPTVEVAQQEPTIDNPAAQPTETPAPSETPVIAPTEVPQPTEVVPESTATEIPPTETVIIEETVTPSPTVEFTATPTVTDTVIPTATSSDITWKLEVDIVINAEEIASQGGMEAAKNSLIEQVSTNLTDTSVQHSVTETTINGNSAFNLTLQGDKGVSQFRQAVFVDLAGRLKFLSGPISFVVNAKITKDKYLPLSLESNPSTGSMWDVTEYDSQMIEVISENDLEPIQDRVGAPMKQTIRLRALNDGDTVIQMVYRRPFEPGATITRRMTLNVPLLPDSIDLSNPVVDRSATSISEMELPIQVNAQSTDPSRLPTSYDWHSQGQVTSVKNQGSCGSCWAFSTVGAMEAAMLIQSGVTVDLSEQYLVACNSDGWGCDGGWWAHNYHISKNGNNSNPAGAVLESAFPYTSGSTGVDGTCNYIANHPYKLASWYSIAGSSTTPTSTQIKQAIYDYGPISVAICAGSNFSNYSGGVFSTNESSYCGGGINHAVVLTGWNDTEQSWTLKNSWGTSWGESGYMRIKWGTSNVGYSANYVVYSGGTVPTATSTPTWWNDDFGNPISIDPRTRSYNNTQDTTSATLASDDPTFSCVSRKGNHSVWYKMIAPASGTLALNTTGSDYDTILGVYQGTRGSLTSKACNDDIGSGNVQSSTSLSVALGQVYYIEVAGYYDSSYGSLTLNASFTPSASPTYTTPYTAGTYDDTHANIIYSGWNNNAVNGDYNNTEHYSATIGSTTRFAFTGTNLSLKFRKHSSFGILNVIIDDTAYEVNQNSTSHLYQQQWDGPTLTGGTHYVTLTHSTGTYVTLDAIIIGGAVTPTVTNTSLPPVTPGTYDDTTANILYTGSWGTISLAGDYNNAEHYSYNPGSIASLTFTGSSVTVLYRRHSAFGVMNVSIDGGTAVAVNQYNLTQEQQVPWTSSEYASGTHTLTITHVSGTYITIDAIIVNGPTTPTLTYTPTLTRTPTLTLTPRSALGVGTYDDSVTDITYSSGWGSIALAGDYNNGEHYSAVIGSSATFAFNSTSLTLVFRRNPVFGVMNVSIDGGAAVAVNQYGSAQQQQVTWTSSEYTSGAHTVRLTHTTGTYITLDAVIINGPTTPTSTNTPRPAMAVGTYDDTDANILYGGSWGTIALGGDYNNSEHYSAVAGSTASFSFNSTSVTLIFRRNPAFGVMNVSIDGGTAVSVNQYASSQQQQASWTSSIYESGIHTLTLTHASGTYITLDAVTVDGPTTPTATNSPQPAVTSGTYDDTDTNIVYTGSWGTIPLGGNYNSTEHYSAAVGSSASLRFNSTSITLVFRRHPAMGVLNVSIDGATAVAVNQYGSSQVQQATWTSGTYAAGDHTLTLTHASGTYVDLDAIIVNGPVTPTVTSTPRTPVGTGTYDDRDANLVYTGSWSTMSLASDYNGTEHYSAVVGSSASLSFTGSYVTILYRAYPSFGVMNVVIDGGTTIPVSQVGTSMRYQTSWNSSDLGNGAHTLRITHASGTYITLDAITISDTAPVTLKPWTFMVYLAADNNLEGAALTDFAEMASVGSDSNINIVVQLDRSSSYVSTYDNWTTTKRFYVTKNMTPNAANALSDLGEMNMGSAATLQDFVAWGKENYPAQKYALVLWNHGGGWLPQASQQDQDEFINPLQGIGWDDTNNSDYLTNVELSTVLSNVTSSGANKLDLVAMDACLMAMLEVDYHIAPYALARASSEATEPWDGYPYGSILGDLAANPSMTGVQLANAISTWYYASYSNSETQSAVQFGTPFTNLVTAVNNFGTVLTANMSTYKSTYTTARANTYYFESGIPYSDYVDLYDFAQEIYNRVSNTAVRNAAQAVMTAISAAVTNNKADSSYAHGITIYFPNTLSQWTAKSTNYINTQYLSRDGQWDNFLQSYWQ